jgi:hypothetical protein
LLFDEFADLFALSEVIGAFEVFQLATAADLSVVEAEPTAEVEEGRKAEANKLDGHRRLIYLVLGDL